MGKWSYLNICVKQLDGETLWQATYSGFDVLSLVMTFSLNGVRWARPPSLSIDIAMSPPDTEVILLPSLCKSLEEHWWIFPGNTPKSVKVLKDPFVLSTLLCDLHCQLSSVEPPRGCALLEALLSASRQNPVVPVKYFRISVTEITTGCGGSGWEMVSCVLTGEAIDPL